MDDRAIYQDYLNGNSKAFDTLIERYRSALIFYANSFVHSLEDAEDIAQDAFVVLFLNRKRFRQDSSVKTYLYGVTRRIALSHLRKQRALSIDDVPEIADSNLEDAFLQEEQKQILHRALDELKDDYRQVLHLAFLHNCSTEEIGRILKKSKKQIYNLSACAKRSLRLVLEEKGYRYDDFR